mgnify:CR=1 FL=1
MFSHITFNDIQNKNWGLFILKNLRKRCLKITEPYNLSTIDDFFERTHGSYMWRIEKAIYNTILDFSLFTFNVIVDQEDTIKIENLIKYFEVTWDFEWNVI